MFTSNRPASSVKSWFARKSPIVVIAFAAVVLAASAANANSTCQRVTGFVEEAPLSGPACVSPVGLCTQFTFRGVLRGEGEFTAATFITTTDTATTGVVFSTGDSIIHARIGSRQGDLIVKPAAVYHTAGEGELLDIQTIVGGTGDFAGASGVLTVVGNFLFPDGGTSAYDGSVCTP
jgi:hypothetical protein